MIKIKLLFHLYIVQISLTLSLNYRSLSLFDLRTSLGQIATDALRETYDVEHIVSFDIPTQDGRGDLTSVAALQCAKLVGKPPQEIAQTILSAVESTDGIVSAEVAEPGYVNVHVAPDHLFSSLSEIWKQTEKQETRDEAPVIIEYSSPNIAKPLSVHHVIGTVIGQALANIYEHLGYNVIKWNYFGDWGTQFGKLAVAYEQWGEGKPVKEYSIDDLLSLYVRFHDELEKDPSLETKAHEAFRKLEEGDNDMRTFWSDVVDASKQEFNAMYERLHISYDVDLGESFYEDKMQPILDEGKKKNVFTEGDGGALIVEFAEETKMPPYMVQKSDGGTLYSTRDLAQMRYRMDTYKPQGIYILTDIAQKLHFEQLVATCRLLKWELPDFENVLFGRMSFADKSMSTRKGNVIKLSNVLDEAVERAGALIDERNSELDGDERKELEEMMGVGSVAYGVLNQHRTHNIVFDWNTIMSFDGNSAPYVQYTHARARSILRKAGEESLTCTSTPHTEDITASERTLIHALLRFSSVVRDACNERLPHKLCIYVYELCQAYNAFYGAEQIVKAEEPHRTLRLQLTALTAHVIKTSAELLTLRVPNSM